MTPNRYGLLALEFCRRYRPRAWMQMSDPPRHFQALGEEIQGQVTRQRDELVGPPRNGENPIELTRRSTQALATAEELVLADHPEFQPEPSDPKETVSDLGLARYRLTLAEINATIHQQLEPE